jgi:hypothetical protein
VTPQNSKGANILVDMETRHIGITLTASLSWGHQLHSTKVSFRGSLMAVAVMDTVCFQVLGDYTISTAGNFHLSY